MRLGSVELPSQQRLQILRRRLGALAHQLVMGVEASLDQPLYPASIEGTEALRQVAEAQQGSAAHAGVAMSRELSAGALGPLTIFGLERHLDHEPLELDRVVALQGGFGALAQFGFRFRHAGSLARDHGGSFACGAACAAHPCRGRTAKYQTMSGSASSRTSKPYFRDESCATAVSSSKSSTYSSCTR